MSTQQPNLAEDATVTFEIVPTYVATIKDFTADGMFAAFLDGFMEFPVGYLRDLDDPEFDMQDSVH